MSVARESYHMEVEPGSRVKIAFTATYPDGKLFDTSSPEVASRHGEETEKRFRPIVLDIGSEPTIESLETGLIGMTEGETKTIQVPHDDLTLTYERTAFTEMVDQPPESGLQLHTATGLLGEVVSVDEDTVTVDFDPERAGETLTFEVEVLEVQ